MTNLEKIKQLCDWLNEGDSYTINRESYHSGADYDEAVETGTLSFIASDDCSHVYDGVDIVLADIEEISWVDDSYCHVAMNDGQGWEFRSWEERQREAPV